MPEVILNSKTARYSLKYPRKETRLLSLSRLGIPESLLLLDVLVSGASLAHYGGDSSQLTYLGAEQMLSWYLLTSAKVWLGRQLADFLGVVSANIWSTCSRVSPLVSGTKKYE